jgi:hypothetical protein
VPLAFTVPSDAITLTVPPPAGVAMAGADSEVPGYDPGTRFYTAAGLARLPAFVQTPGPTPTPFSCFVALIDPGAGDYAFSVSP